MVKLVCFDCSQVNQVPADRIGSGPKCGTCGGLLFSGKAQAIDAVTLAKAIRTDEVPLVVDFWAPWCGPCRGMAPAFSKAASVLKGKVRLVKLNTEAHPKATSGFAVRGIPTMISFRNGKECDRQVGALPEAGIRKFATG